MKKISILSLHLGYGGIERSIVNLANILCSRYEVEIACSYRLYDKSAFDLDPRVKVKYLIKDLKPNHDSFKEALKNKNIIRILKESFVACKVLFYRRKTMVHYIKTKKCDVIISTRDLFNYWLSAYGKKNVLKIGWEHNHYHENYKYADHVSRSAMNLDFLVLVSSELQKFYAKRLRNSECMCVFIPNSIDKIPTNLAPLNNHRFVSVGRLSSEKGFIDLLTVYKRLHKKHPTWTLDIVGDGPEREKLEKYIEKNKLTDVVTLHGFQGRDVIDKILHESSIYLMSSYTESFGIVLIEAMSHGLPCIAFDSAEGAREIISSGENGYLIKNRSFKAMVSKTEDLMLDKKVRVSIGKKARESVKKYASDVVGKEWFTLIEESDVCE